MDPFYADYPDFGLTAAQRHEAVFGHYYERPGMDGETGEIWCYTNRFSYAPGDVATFFISATAARIHLEIVRDGPKPSTVLSRLVDGAAWQEAPDQCSVTGCGWQPTFELAIPHEWPSGAYKVLLRADGNRGRQLRGEHLFIVTPARGGRSRVLQIAATGSWMAYNTWGGSNHYQGITGPDRDQFAKTVSSQRPWCRGFVTLPVEAPRVPVRFDPPPMTPPRYPHMEWAFANGHSKKYASAGWASYDSHFFKWAERAGYAIDLATQHELQFSPDLLSGYDCVVFVGHDEYWSWEMRDAVDAYVEAGGRAARFAGNFLWQTRLSADGTRQTCYKYKAREEDPVFRSSDTSRTTNAWDAPEVGRPTTSTFGLKATSGIYVGWGGCAPRGGRGFPIYRPEHWAFRDTGLYYGDVLGAGSQIFGYEVDGLDHVIRNGLPEPTPDSGAMPGTEILAVGLASQVEENADMGAPLGWLNDDDGRFTAQTLYGEASDANLDRVKRGNGMIVTFPKGKGEVFHAGSCEWVAGLLRGDAMVEKVTANVLDRYLGKS